MVVRTAATFCVKSQYRSYNHKMHFKRSKIINKPYHSSNYNKNRIKNSKRKKTLKAQRVETHSAKATKIKTSL